MILQLLLLAIAFFGTWLMLQPTRQFTYARETTQLPNPSPILNRARCIAGFVICFAAITAILMLQV